MLFQGTVSQQQRKTERKAIAKARFFVVKWNYTKPNTTAKNSAKEQPFQLVLPLGVGIKTEAKESVRFQHFSLREKQPYGYPHFFAVPTTRNNREGGLYHTLSSKHNIYPSLSS